MVNNFLTISQLENMVDYYRKIDESDYCRNSFKAFLICCYTGLTLSQLKTLKYGNTDEECLYVNMNGKLRKLALNGVLKDIIGEGHPGVNITEPARSKTILKHFWEKNYLYIGGSPPARITLNTPSATYKHLKYAEANHSETKDKPP